MEITQEQTLFIRNAFAQMSTKQDFLLLLNYVKKIIYTEKTVPFDLRQLNYYINAESDKVCYRTFSVKKKAGGERVIYAPVKGLKVLQSCLNIVLQQICEISEHAKGFVPGKSIVDNANPHIGKIYVYNIDLKDFFPSIDIARFWGRLKSEPFNLIGRMEIANMICAISGHRMPVERLNESGVWVTVEKNVLPQGAPTSPVISNIICETLDRRLKGVAKKYGAEYSRYADDITFSSMHSIYAKQGPFLKEILRIINDQNFQIKVSKTRLQTLIRQQSVTGLIVNQKPNVNRRYVEQIRRWLHYWDKKEINEARHDILHEYNESKPDSGREEIHLGNLLSGKLEFLKMVRGENDPTYERLRSKLELLTSRAEVEVHENNLNKEQFELQVQKKKHTSALDVETFRTIHDPKRLIGLLKNFSANKQALKYTTHSWDAGRDADIFQNMETFLSAVDYQYSLFSFALKSLSNNLNGKIFGFLLNKKIYESGWGTHRVQFGWSSPELLQATLDNPGLNPEDVILPIQYQRKIEGKTIQKFKHVIDLFKNEIEIRDENSALHQLILQKHDKYLSAFEPPVVENLRNKTFYTDVQWLSNALNLIFENISNRPDHKKVSYSLNDSQHDRNVLRITHQGSSNAGKSYTDYKFAPDSGSFGDVKTYLTNLCDWSVESAFAEGNFRINYLVSNPDIPAVEKLPSVSGFTHVLTFYKQ